MKVHIRSLLLSLSVLAVCFGTAEAADWVVSKINPPAQYSADGDKWHALSVGKPIPDGSWVRTGERGMLLLEKDAGSVLFKPGSLAEITSEFEGRAGTSIKQRSGALLLDVETRDRAHTEVQTPFLAAVVKGTKFESRVGKWDAEIEVRRGIVEVTHIRRGERADLRAGQTARVGDSAALPIVFFGSSEKPKTGWVSPGEPLVLPLDNGAMSGGWGSNTTEQAWRLLGGVSKAAVAVAMAILAALIIITLMMKRHLTLPRPSAGLGAASSWAGSKERRSETSADGGSSGEAFLTTGLVATFSACIVGLVAIAMPGFSPAAVLGAMTLALFVLLLVVWLAPSRGGAKAAREHAGVADGVSPVD